MTSEATTQVPPPAYTPAGSPQTPPKTVVRRWKSTFWLALSFIALLVTTWTLLCVLDVRPISGNVKSWSVVNGTIDEGMVESGRAWYRALQAISTLTAALTVPVLSIIISHAAVVFAQRRHPRQRLNALELLMLADAPWSRLSPGIEKTKFVIAALALTALGAVQSILQVALVAPEQIQVATSLDVPGATVSSSNAHNIRYEQIGYEPNPASIMVVPRSLVVSEVAARMAVDALAGVQNNLWLDKADSDPRNVIMMRDYLGPSFYYYGRSSADLRWFTSAVPAGANTGVLRYHAMRLNSSIECETQALEDFPETCNGSHPFLGDTTLQDNGTDAMRIRWCVPGDSNSSPWTRSRSHQDIFEELFVQMVIPDNSTYKEVFYSTSESFSMHCSASTTRGPFELPNIHNQDQPGPLLERWPSPEDIYANFNDKKSSSYSARIPTENDTTDVEYIYWPYYSSDIFYTGQSTEAPRTPGPLAVAMISMLGNDSWFHNYQNQTLISNDEAALQALISMCTGGAPFINWGSIYGVDKLFDEARSQCSRLSSILAYGSFGSTTVSQLLPRFAFDWFKSFNDTSNVNRTLSAAMLFANEATLTRATNSMSSEGYSRQFSRAPGSSLTKPSISLPAKIFISLLIGIEAAAIIGLLVYIYRTPTFSRRLDAVTIAVIGAQLFSTGLPVPKLGFNDKKALSGLLDHDGLIGVHVKKRRGLSHQSRVGEATHTRNGSQDASTTLNEIELEDLRPDRQAHIAELFDVPVGGLVLGGGDVVSRRAIRSKPLPNTPNEANT